MTIKAPRQAHAKPLQRRAPGREPARRLFDRDEYYRMAEAGFFEGQRVELIDGEILAMSPQAWPHATTISILNKWLVRLAGEAFTVRVQCPLAVSSESEPEPDLAVIPGAERTTPKPHPSTASFIIEVSDTTLSYDRHRKGGLYAKAGVPEYWIVDLKHRRLEIRRDPVPMPGKRHGYGYRSLTTHGETEVVRCPLAPDTDVAVRDLLP